MVGAIQFRAMPLRPRFTSLRRLDASRIQRASSGNFPGTLVPARLITGPTSPAIIARHLVSGHADLAFNKRLTGPKSSLTTKSSASLIFFYESSNRWLYVIRGRRSICEAPAIDARRFQPVNQIIN
jgi:hypothetical protein